MNRLISSILLFCIALGLFTITAPLIHEPMHFLIDSIPGSGVKPVSINLFSVSVEVYGTQTQAWIIYLVGELLGFSCQFAITLYACWIIVRKSKAFNIFPVKKENY